jgi:transcription elongation factor Elf1
MGRRKRKTVSFPKKRLPTIFACPSCGESAINIKLNKDTNSAEVKCSICGIREILSFSSIEKPVDIYCKFTDGYYAGTMERELIESN